MLNYFKAIIVFLIWSCIALTSHYFISSFYLTKKISSPIKNPIAFFGVTNSKNDTLFRYKKKFKIKKNSSNILNLNSYNSLFDSIASYLNKNYDSELDIIGFYENQEKDTIAYKNLGLLRAKNVKSYFQNIGITNYQIKISSEINNNLFETNSKTSGIKLKLAPISIKTKDSIETSITKKRLYLNLKSNELIVTKAFTNYTNLLKQYLKKHPSKSVFITGHTDNKGYYQNNVIIGLKRANLVKDYFVLNGIERSKIIALSKGESEPIADKNTLEGKAKNRRIEIKIN